MALNLQTCTAWGLMFDSSSISLCGLTCSAGRRCYHNLSPRTGPSPVVWKASGSLQPDPEARRGECWQTPPRWWAAGGEWQWSDLFLSTSHVMEINDDLYQGCQIYGPWAKPGPHEVQIRPHVRGIWCRNYERPKLQFVLAVVEHDLVQNSNTLNVYVLTYIHTRHKRYIWISPYLWIKILF